VSIIKIGGLWDELSLCIFVAVSKLGQVLTLSIGLTYGDCSNSILQLYRLQFLHFQLQLPIRSEKVCVVPISQLSYAVLHFSRRVFIFENRSIKRHKVVTSVAPFLPRDGQHHILHSLHLPTEGWPGWVGLSGMDKYRDGRPPNVVTNPNTNRARRSITSLMWRTPLPLRQTSHQYSVFCFYGKEILSLVLSCYYHTFILCIFFSLCNLNLCF